MLERRCPSLGSHSSPVAAERRPRAQSQGLIVMTLTSEAPVSEQLGSELSAVFASAR